MSGSALLGNDLWPTITRLARQARRMYVAVAYLGKGGSNLLPLSGGDYLVVNMSRRTVKEGQTNPSEIEKYLKKGVNVFKCSNLHAKAFVFDGTTIVCSANVSNYSRYGLIEAGLLCRDRDAVSRVRGWIRSLQKDPVTLGYVKLCKEWYRPPSMPRHADKSRGSEVLPSYSTVWLLGGLKFCNFSKEEERFFKRDAEKAFRKIKIPRRYQVATVWHFQRSRFSQRIAEGDLIIQVVSDKSKTRLYPPCRVLKTTRSKTSSGNLKRGIFVHVEEPYRFRSIGWRYFKKELAKVGYGRITENSVLEIKSLEARSVALGLWS